MRRLLALLALVALPLSARAQLGDDDWWMWAPASSQNSIAVPLSTPGCYTSPASLSTAPTVTLSSTRATNGSAIVSGANQSCTANQVRVGDSGLIAELNATQYVLNPTTHPKAAEATNALSTGAATAWHVGAGTMTIAAGTATVTGLACTGVAAGTLCQFNVTSGGTMLVTTTAGVTFSQVENRPYAGTRILAAGTRNNDPISFTTTTTAQRRALSKGTMTWTPFWAAGQSQTYAILENEYLWGSGSGGTSVGLFYPQNTVAGFGFTPSIGRGASIYYGPEINFAPYTAMDIGWLLSSSTSCIYVNGVRTCTPSSDAYAPGATSYLGATGSGTLFSNAAFKNVRFGATPSVYGNSKAIAALGDSITLASLCSTVQWPRKVARLKGAGYFTGNFGVGGDTVSMMLARWQGTNDIKANGYRVLVFMGGTNDLAAGATAAATWATAQQILDDAHAAGFYVIPISVLPSGSITGAEITETQTYNTSLSTWAAGHSRPYVNAVPTFDGGGFTPDGTHFADGTHLNQLGCDALAPLVSTVVP